MKKIIIIGALALTVASSAFAQSNYKEEQAKLNRQVDRSQHQSNYSDAVTKARIEANARERESQQYYKGMQKDRLDTQRAINKEYNDTQRAINREYIQSQERMRESQDPYGRTRKDIPLQK